MGGGRAKREGLVDAAVFQKEEGSADALGLKQRRKEQKSGSSDGASTRAEARAETQAGGPHRKANKESRRQRGGKGEQEVAATAIDVAGSGGLHDDRWAPT